MPTYATPGPVNVRIDLPLSETRIIASHRDTTVVDILGDDAGIRCVLSGTQLTVATAADRGACRVRTDYGDVHLDEVGPTDIRSRHAEISVEHASADLEITTSSGDVRVGVIEGSAAITDNDSDITLTEARGPVQLRGSHGDMAIERMSANLLARNAYGSVRVTEVAEGTCDIATTYGEVEIGIAEGTAAWLDVRSDTGTVHNRLDDAARHQIRKLFRRLSPVFPIARPLGLAARMTAEQHAEINIEINELMGALDPVLARNPNIQVSATVASNHSKILRKDLRAVADAVRAIAVTANTPER